MAAGYDDGDGGSKVAVVMMTMFPAGKVFPGDGSTGGRAGMGGRRCGSEFGSELTLLAGSELKTNKLDTCELKTSEYRFLKIFIVASYEQELCHFNFLLASCQLSSSELQTDLASWQQHLIELYGKENECTSWKSIDEGTFFRWNISETFAEGNKDAPGRFFPEVKPKEDRTTGFGGALNSVRNANPGQARQENGVALDEEQLLFLAGGQHNVVDEDVDEQPVQDLALNVDNAFQADDYDAFDPDVDEAPTAQTMFMANLSSADLVYDEAGPSYDLDILSEVHDHDHYQDVVCEHHEEHEMHDDV
ncbi:hypothetical protein Tco_0553346 [Tanacetum coccineum]